MKKSLEKAENVLLSSPKNFAALAVALSQCRHGFRVEVVHTPMSFSKLTSLNSIKEPGEVPYTLKFSWYVNFTDFTVSRAVVKIYSVKNCHQALFRKGSV